MKRALTLRKKSKALLCLILAALLAAPAFAVTAAPAEDAPDGTLAFTLADPEGALAGLTGSGITVTADGTPAASVTLEPAVQSQTFLVFLDLSDAVTKSGFEEIKASLTAMNEKKAEGDALVLYTFGDEVKRILDGSETPEAAAQAVAALARNAQHTDFYDAMALLPEAAAGAAGTVVPIVISDGDDNCSAASRADALDALRAFPCARLYCPDSAEEGLGEAFAAFADEAGLPMRVFTSGEEASLFSSVPSVYDLTVTLPEDFAGQEGSAIEITVPGQEEPLRLTADTSAWTHDVPETAGASETESADTSAPETIAVETQPAPEKDPARKFGGSLYTIAGGAVLLILIAALVLVKKKGKSKAAPARQKPVTPAEDDKRTKENHAAKKKDEPQVRFYFEDGSRK